mgnify:CR=1 FL=1
MRKPIIAGNWKMNKTPAEAAALVTELIPLVKDAKCDVVVCTPSVCFAAVAPILEGTNVKLGAQNVHFAEKGAYTGEISASMLTEVGAQYVVIGHSERRQYFAETDETVNLKIKAALAAGLTPIVCVGETLEERESGVTEKVVSGQTRAALRELTEGQARACIIAYEPIWAIGTGRTATAAQADEVCGIIRAVVAGLYAPDTAEALTIQYGGSMNAANAEELLAKYHVDGGLIGGASLKAQDFATIVRVASK